MGNALREVYIIGVGQSKFAKQPAIDGIDLGVIAVSAALEDCGIDPRRLEVCYAARIEEASTTGQDVMRHFGVERIETHNLENACSSGGSSVRCLWKDIAYGVYDTGIAIGLESLSTSPIGGGLVPSANTSLLNVLGIPAISNQSFFTHNMMKQRGYTLEDIAYPAYRSHQVAQYNPYAHIKKAFTIEEILASEMIASPITKYMCCPMSDGAAAVIMCTKEIAMQYTTKPVLVSKCYMESGVNLRFEDDITYCNVMQPLSQRVYDESSIGPEDLCCVELHDAYSPEELYAWELLGLCPMGGASKLIRDGDVTVGGKCPVNLSGGLLSLGHPLAASGTRIMVDLTRQLRGQADPAVQVPKPGAALAQMCGGQLPNRWNPEACFMAMLQI